MLYLPSLLCLSVVGRSNCNAQSLDGDYEDDIDQLGEYEVNAEVSDASTSRSHGLRKSSIRKQRRKEETSALESMFL